MASGSSHFPSFSGNLREYSYIFFVCNYAITSLTLQHTHTRTHTQTSSYLVLVGSLKQGILSTWQPKIATHLKLLRDVSKVDGHPRSLYHLLSCLFIDGPVFSEARYSSTAGEVGEKRNLMCHRSVGSRLAKLAVLCHTRIALLYRY